MAEITTTRGPNLAEFIKAGSSPPAVETFWKALHDRQWDGLNDPDAGERAAELLIASSESEWWEDGAGVLLTARQASSLLEVTASDLEALAAENRLFTVSGPGSRLRYPLSQFDIAEQRPWAILPEVLTLLRSVRMSDESIASWFHKPHPKNELDGSSCEQWLRQGRPPDTIVDIARRTVYDLSH